jgi:hypothetical protein
MFMTRSFQAGSIRRFSRFFRLLRWLGRERQAAGLQLHFNALKTLQYAKKIDVRLFRIAQLGHII